MKRIAFVLAFAALPIAAPADPKFVTYAPLSEKWFPKVHVKAGTSVDVQLLPGDEIADDRNAIVADPRWGMTHYTSGGTSHVVLKPTSKDLGQVQMLVIPGAQHAYHVLIDSSTHDGSTYTLVFVANRQTEQISRVSAQPTPQPTVANVKACVAPLFTKYRVTGDKRVPVQSVCDDGVRTYIIMDAGARTPSVTPYSVDVGGKQDQIENALFVSQLNEWVLAGTFDKLALLTDSSKGQIRASIERLK